MKDPERYNWHPKRLIAALARIHLNLFAARRRDWVAAVAADTDYYGRAPQLLRELVSVRGCVRVCVCVWGGGGVEEGAGGWVGLCWRGEGRG